jgi:hypothetical protein
MSKPMPMQPDWQRAAAHAQTAVYRRSPAEIKRILQMHSNAAAGLAREGMACPTRVMKSVT